MGKLADIKKGTNSSVLDYSVQIFEAISDNIEMSVNKYRENKNRGDKPQSDKNVKERPQDKYKDIKTAIF